MNSKLHSSTLESTRHILGDDSPIVRELEQKLKRKSLVTKLVGMRAAKGLSQADVAKKMNCSQSRISKLESSDDADVRLGDLQGYLEAIGLDIHGVISPKDWAAVSQIKFHASQIRDCLAKLCQMAEGDLQISEGVQRFHVEALANLMNLVVESSQRLPSSLLIEAPAVVNSEDHESESENGLACAD